MEQKNEIGALIKKFIKYRNKTIKITAKELGIKYTTFSEQLNNGSISVDTLFRLSAYLDIDLNWMMAVLNYYGSSTAIDREMIPRMQQSFRDNEKVQVLNRLDHIIIENPMKTVDARRELLAEFGHNEFYLLGVLVPEEYDIFFVKDREKTKLYVDTHEQMRNNQLSLTRRKPITMLIEANQALDIVIEERKDIIL